MNISPNTTTPTRGIVAVRADASDASALLPELTKAFADFKSRYSGKHTELEQALEAQNKAIARLTVGGAGAPASERDATSAAIAGFLAAAQRRHVDPREAEGVDLTDYHAGFGQYLRRGDALAPDVKAAMSVGSDPDGGYYVDPARLTVIERRIFDTSDMRRVARVVPIQTGDALEFPIAPNRATSGGWVGEKAARPATDTPQVGVHRIPVHEQYAMPEITQKLLDDSNLDVGMWLEEMIADELGRTENTAFVSGDGVARPKGFLAYAAASVTTGDNDSPPRDWGVLQRINSGAAGGFPALSGVSGVKDVGALHDAIASLKPTYRAGARWLMNRATEAEIRKLKDADGRFLLQPGLAEAAPSTLLGYPISTMEDMPDLAADSFSIAFGNFQVGYMIVDRMGIRVLRDPFTNRPLVRFYVTKRVGADVVNFDAIKLLKMAA